MPVPIFCGDCGATGEVGRVTAGLQCRCGSHNLGLQGIDDVLSMTANRWNASDPEGGTAEKQDEAAGRGSDSFGKPLPKDDPYHWDPTEQKKESGLTAEALQRIATPQGPGTGWNKVMPSPTRGWNEYAGPLPGANPKGVSVSFDEVCPACKGSGYDLIDKTTCRECHGTGRIQGMHPTSQPGTQQLDPHQGPPVGGARWQGHTGAQTFTNASTVTIEGPAFANTGARITPGGVEDILRSSTPDYGGVQREMPGGVSDAYKVREPHSYEHGNSGLRLDQAYCPECGNSPTQVIRDRGDNAWWHCPNCGPLVNIDKRPQVDPYNPYETGYSQPDRSMKRASRLLPTRKTGRLFKVVAQARASNALNDAEVLWLARKTLMSFPEER